MTYRVERYTNRTDWLEARTRRVQASEVAALFSDPSNPLRGLSRYDSPLSLSLVKRGYLPFERKRDRDEEDGLEWRRQQEPLIARWWGEKIQPDLPKLEGVKPAVMKALRAAPMEDFGDFAIATTDDGFPWGATVDRVILWRDEPLAVVELKTASQFMESNWTAEPPLPYALQVQQQMAILGVEHGFIVATIGGQAPRWAYVPARPKTQAIIRARIAEFWKGVEADQDPIADGSKATAAALLQRWPEETGETVKLPPEASEMWDRRQKAHEAIKNLSLRKDTYTNRLKQAMGSATYGLLPDGRRLSLRATKRGTRLLKEATVEADELAVA